MPFRTLTPDYTTSPQITLADIPGIRGAGYKTVICNRPDSENPPELRAEVLRAAIEAAGMKFVVNPVIGGALTAENVVAQADAIRSSDGPVFAYCASGNRSSIVWALAEAGQRDADQMIAAAAKWGYNLEPYRAQIEARSAN